MEGLMNEVVAQILRDLEVELTDEFDRNFERQAFFTESWQRHRSPVREGGHVLVATGGLRRSLRAVVTADSIALESTLPYAAIHNDGGKIKVTAKMKRFFWAKYYETAGRFTRKKGGGGGTTKVGARLSTVAEFWKAMALMKVGGEVMIPRRRFVGWSREVEKAVREIVEENLTSMVTDELRARFTLTGDNGQYK